MDATLIPKDTSDERLFANPFGKEYIRPIRDVGAVRWNRFGMREKSLCVNFVGPNGAGKSVFPKVLCNLDPEHYWVTGEDGKTKVATVFPNLGWATVGFYKTGCGGCDALIKNEIFEGMHHLLKTDLHFLIEGSIVSNTKTTYWDAFKAIAHQHPNRYPAFVVFAYEFEKLHARIMTRNGGEPINEDMLRQKHTNIARYLEGYLYEESLPVHIEATEGLRPTFLSVKTFLDSVLGADCLPGFNLF